MLISCLKKPWLFVAIVWVIASVYPQELIGWQETEVKFSIPSGSEEELLKKLGDRAEAIIQEGDRVLFLRRSNAASVKLNAFLNIPFKPIGRNGLHAGQMQLSGCEQLILSYAFAENGENALLNAKHFRGKEAPAIPQSVSQLQGRLYKYLLASKHLGESRNVDIYQPTAPGTAPLPVVYITDGRALSEVVGSIDWQIQQGKIAPVVVVAMYSGSYRGNKQLKHQTDYDFRALEYLAGLGDDRYSMHQKFVKEEVIPFAEKNHRASSQPAMRALSGYSNGGAYVVTSSVNEPELFGHVFAYSVAYFDPAALKQAAENKKLPEYRFAAGTLEQFIRGTRLSHEILSEAGAKTDMRTYVAGHDPLMWQIALLEDLEETFPGPKSLPKQ